MEETENNLQSNFQSVQDVRIKKSFFKSLNITIEPIFLIFFFCISLIDAPGTNLILSRTCKVVFHFSHENCTGELAPEINMAVQPYVSRILMVSTIIEAIFSATLSLFIGSWIDISKRRKPFLILPIVGASVDYIIWLIFLYLPVHPIYFILTVIPHSIAGGSVSIFTCGFSYLSDVTSEDNRTFRMSLPIISLSVGVLFGYLVSIEICDRVHFNNYLITFGLSLICSISILFYAMFILPETSSFTEASGNNEVINQTDYSFFDVSHIKHSMNVLLEKRPSNGRIVLGFLIAILVINMTVFQGESNFRYLSLKAAFSWRALDYNIFSAIFTGVACIAGIVGVWLLNKVLGLSESFLVFLIVSMALTSSILQSISRSTFDYYCAVLLNALNVIISPLVKSEVSQIIPNCDIGKVFAFISTLEAITPFIASPAYTEVYNAVLPYAPLYLYFLSSSFWLIAFIFSLNVLLINYCYGRNLSYQLLDEITEKENGRCSTSSISVIT